MSDLRQAAQQALGFTLRDFATVRDFEAARAALHDVLRTALEQQQAEPDRWVIEKVDGKLLLNGAEIGPGTIDVRLDGLTYRSAEKAAVRQQAEPVCRNCIGTGWEPSMYDGRRPCGFCQSAPLQPQPQQQAEPLADGAIHAAWSAGYVEGEKAALEQQAEPFSPEVINTTQTAWKMGYEAAKAEQQQAGPVGQLQECLYGRGQVLWFEKPADLSMLYTAPPQQQAEPVAYLSYKPIPLYTYTISPQRKQLTVERIHHLCSAFHQWSEWDDASYRQLWVDLVRSVEADHDIKEGT